MERTKDGYRLSTGREFSAFDGRLSVSPDRVDDPDNAPATFCSYGSDGSIIDSWFMYCGELNKDCWTLAERAEVADYMIALWEQFKAANPLRRP
jgi:hypothetical protein